MPIKKKSMYQKYELEYESPDGLEGVPEKYVIFYVENEGRKYIQIGREGMDDKDFTTWDWEMFLEIGDFIRSMTNRQNRVQQITGGGRPHLRSPTVTDHRETRSEIIDSTVKESMRHLNDTDTPMESFSTTPESIANEWRSVQTGVDPRTLDEMKDTPEDLVRQRDSINRTTTTTKIQRPNIYRGDTGGQGDGQFRRVVASDIL